MIIIFGGTSEGRQLAKVCDFGKVEAKICVAKRAKSRNFFIFILIKMIIINKFKMS